MKKKILTTAALASVLVSGFGAATAAHSVTTGPVKPPVLSNPCTWGPNTVTKADMNYKVGATVTFLGVPVSQFLKDKQACFTEYYKSDVRSIQVALNNLGTTAHPTPPPGTVVPLATKVSIPTVKVTGVFDDATKEAVYQFQKATFNKKPTGEVDLATARALRLKIIGDGMVSCGLPCKPISNR